MPHGPDGSIDASVGDLKDPVDIAVDMNVIYSDFPNDPVLSGTAPANSATLFSGSSQPGDGGQSDGGQGAGPCLIEPALGAVYPSNWTQPYFEWTPVGTDNLFELRFHLDNQSQDLVVYTDQKTYTLDASLWTALSLHSAGHDIEFSIRSGTLESGALTQGPHAGSAGTLHIAPVPASGSVVYWTTSSGSALKGFSIGDKSVITLVTPTTMADGTTCIGCHTSSPDGKLAFLSRTSGAASGAFTVDARLVDGTANKASSMQISSHAFDNLARANQTLPTTSAAHYSDTDAVIVTALQHADTNNKWELVWTDLHATSGGTGIIQRTGDSNLPATPSFSHDGMNIAYTSTTTVYDGRPSSALTDIYVVPYNNRAGGTAKALDGAHDPDLHEYYPSYSPSDTFIAFNISPKTANTYSEPKAEVYVVPAKGGTPTRLAANDPPACANTPSPGVSNSWPRWSPEAPTANGKRYYWIVFSSTRRYAHPQLYVAAVVTNVTAKGEVISAHYPALHVTSQPTTESNHTPAWDVFQLVIP